MNPSRLALAANYMAVPVPHFVSFEVGNLIEPLSRLGFVAAVWPWSVIAVLRMKPIIYVAMEVGRAMKPRANANEDAA